MNPNPDPRLEARITRELKSLGELPAPAGLAGRVLRAVEARQLAPWYRRAWTTWPRGLQVGAVLLLAVGFAGICWLGGGVSTSASDVVAAQKSSGWLAELGFIWNLFRALGEALQAIVNYIGKGTVIAIGLLIATAYGACISLGSAYVRFAMSRR